MLGAGPGDPDAGGGGRQERRALPVMLALPAIRKPGRRGCLGDHDIRY